MRVAYDAHSLCVVFFFDLRLEDCDVDATVTHWQTIARDARPQLDRYVNAIVVANNPQRPMTRSQQKRLVQAELAVPRLNFAFVTQSLMVRSVVGALNFLGPSPTRVRSTHADLQSAVAWLEERSPGAAEPLVKLLHELRAL